MTVQVTLPDGSIKSFDNAVNGFDIAKSIGSRLAKDAICLEIDNNFYDMNTIFESDISVRIVTNSDPDALHILRHSSAHILAQAVLNLYPDAKYGVGPSIDNGFYYDFLFKEPLKENDLSDIEKEMINITKNAQNFTKSEITKKDAKKLFKNQSFKIELIESAESEEGVLEDVVTMYTNEKFSDLCRGPHIPNTKYLKHFKLTKLGGAYWRGDEENPQLQRIYGTSWFSKKDLNAYLIQQEEAEKRDHRKIGNELNLFTTSNELGSGNFLWKPKGAILRDLIETYSKNAHLNNDYDLNEQVIQLLASDTFLYEYIYNSLILLIGVLILTFIIGVSSAYLVSFYNFPGVNFFKWALILSFAVPPYIYAYSLTAFFENYGTAFTILKNLFGNGDYNSSIPKFDGMLGAIISISFSLFGYVYVLTRASFHYQSQNLIELGNSNRIIISCNGNFI